MRPQSNSFQTSELDPADMAYRVVPSPVTAGRYCHALCTRWQQDLLLQWQHRQLGRQSNPLPISRGTFHDKRAANGLPKQAKKRSAETFGSSLLAKTSSSSIHPAPSSDVAMC